jgi:putative FmdB family regulatory protein
MPYYDYKCYSCEHVFEEFLKMSERTKPEKKPCPACGEKKVKQAILTSPNVGIDFTVDIHKAKGGFKDAMQRVCEAPGIKNSKRAKQLKDRYGL